jgi:predicted small secreted protein
MKGFIWEYSKMAKKILLLVMLVILLVSLVGCQTVQGIGRDITAVGAFCEDVIEKD